MKELLYSVKQEMSVLCRQDINTAIVLTKIDLREENNLHVFILMAITAMCQGALLLQHFLNSECLKLLL